MGDHPEPIGLFPSGMAGALFHEAIDALLVVDPISERVLDANPAAVRLTEFGRDELVHFSLRALIRHEQEWQDWHIGSSCTPMPGSDSFLLRTRQPDRWVPVGINITRLQIPGSDPLALCRLRDRRDQLESQRRLLRVEAELRRLLSCVSDAVYSARIEADGRWRFRHVSPRLQRLTGKPLASLLDSPQAREQSIAPEDLPRWRELAARVSAGQPAELEYRLRQPDGSFLWVRESVVVAPEEGGLLLHGILTDISDRKRAEEGTLAVAREQLRRIDAQARLASRVAHDFNNVITGILGNIHLARLHPASVMDCLARIEEATLRAGEHCRMLSGLAGKPTGSRIHVDLAALARELAGTLAVAGQRVELDAPDDLPVVTGDRDLLRTMLSHLLSNAVEAFEGEPGDIRVTLRHGAIPPLQGLILRHPPEEMPAGCICLEVADSGPGLSAEARAHLFEPYFSTRKGKTGLGLTTVLGIARGMGGAVDVASPAGQGAIIRVLLPAVRPTKVEPPAPVVMSSIGRTTGTVLLIDDEQFVLDISVRLLESAGCRVLAARDGESALAFLRDRRDEIKAILMDWSMPQLSGDLLFRELRRESANVPILLMSGFPAQDLLARLDGMNVAGYLQKPFRLAALLELLRPYLSGVGGKSDERLT